MTNKGQTCEKFVVLITSVFYNKQVIRNPSGGKYFRNMFLNPTLVPFFVYFLTICVHCIAQLIVALEDGFVLLVR